MRWAAVALHVCHNFLHNWSIKDVICPNKSQDGLKLHVFSFFIGNELNIEEDKENQRNENHKEEGLIPSLSELLADAFL